MTNNPPITIVDTYGNNDMKIKNVLIGSQELNYYQKQFIISVIKYLSDIPLAEDKSKEAAWFKNWFSDNRHILRKETDGETGEVTTDYDYDKLVNDLGGHTVELLFAHALIAFEELGDNTLLVRVANIFGRPLKLSNKEDWLDNWRINAPGFAFTMITWNGIDNDNTFNVKHHYDPSSVNINSLNGLTDRQIGYMVKFIVNPARKFMIVNNIFPFNYKLPKKIDENDHIGILKACYSIFPYSYLNAGGCDMHNNIYTVSLELVKRYTDAFPNSMLGVVENTATFASRGGAHWIAVFIYKGVASLLCSQQSEWSIFTDGGKFHNEMSTHYGLARNSVMIQHDNCNCGVYSLLALYKMIVHDGDITRAISSIGENASSFSTGLDTEHNNGGGSKNDMIYRIKSVLFGSPD